MRLGGQIVSASLALAVSFVAVTASAQSDRHRTSAAQPVELARMRYRQGVDAYNAGRYRESVDYFLEADTLAPNAALSYNIAKAYEQLDDPGATLRWYRDYLRRAPEAKDRAETEVVIQKLEGRLAARGVQQLTVLSSPQGATVVIDEQRAGITPLTVEIPPGTHRVALELDGHATETRTVELARDHAQDLSVTLAVAEAAPAPSPPVAPAPPVIAAPPPSPSPPPPKSTFPTKIVGWTLVGVGGAALGTALAFEISRHGAESAARRESTQIGYKDRLDEMESRQTAARIFAVAGTALAVGGGVLVWIGGKGTHEAQPAITAACVPSSCFSTVRGSF